MGKYIWDFNLPGGGQLKRKEQYDTERAVAQALAIPMPENTLYKAEDWKSAGPSELPSLPQAPSIDVSTPPVNMANYHTADLATEPLDDQQVIDRIIKAGVNRGTIVPTIPRLSDMTPEQVSSLPKVDLGPIDKFEQAWKYGEGQQLVNEGYGTKWDNGGIGGDSQIQQGQDIMKVNSGVLDYAHQMKDTSGQGFLASAKEWGKALIDPNYWLVNQALSLPSNWDIAKKQLVAGVAGDLLTASGVAAPVGMSVSAAGVAAATHTEAKMEGQSVYEQIYNEELNKGSTPEIAHQKAKDAADETYIKNIAILAPTNAFEQLSIFGVGADLMGKAAKIAEKSSKIQRMAATAVAMADKAGPVATNAAKEVGRFALTSGSEAGQEGAQYIASQTSMDKDWDFGKEFQENALGGAAMGGGMQIAGRLADVAINRGSDKIQGNVVTPPEDTVAPSINHLTSPVDSDTPLGQAQEKAVAMGANILTPDGSSPADGPTDLAQPVYADSTTITQDLIADHISNGLTKDESWQKLGEVRGGNQGIGVGEFNDLYDAISNDTSTSTPIDISLEAQTKASQVQSIAEQRYGDVPKDSYNVVNVDQTTPELELAKAFVSVSGRDLVVVEPTNVKADRFNGFIDDNMNAVVINNKSDNPVNTVIAHELTHDMEMTTRGIYETFKEDINNSIGVMGGIKQWHNDNHATKFGKTWDQLTTQQKKDQTSEFMADLMQEQSSITGFYDGLLKKSLGAARDFIKSIDHVISKLKGLPVDERYSVQKYIEHWEQAREACQKALVAYTSEKLTSPETRENIPAPPVKETKKVKTEEEIQAAKDAYNAKRREKRAKDKEERERELSKVKLPEPTTKPEPKVNREGIKDNGRYAKESVSDEEAKVKTEQHIKSLKQTSQPSIPLPKATNPVKGKSAKEKRDEEVKKRAELMETKPAVEETTPVKETVRQRMIREARERQEAKGAKFSDKLTSLSSEDFRDYSIEGMSHLLEDPNMSRKEWNKRMMDTFGKGIDFYLDGIYVTSKKLLVMSDEELENFIIDEPAAKPEPAVKETPAKKSTQGLTANDIKLTDENLNNEVSRMSDATLNEELTNARQHKDVNRMEAILDEMDKRVREQNKKDRGTISKGQEYIDIEANDSERRKQYIGNAEIDTTRLTHDEERKLGHAAQAGDEQALTRLLGAYNSLVYKIANRYIMNNHDLTLEDLVQEGRIWLIKTIMDKKKYDPDAPTTLFGPANANIKKGIYRYMNTFGRAARVPEYLAGYYSYYLETEKRLKSEMKETPTDEQVYEAMTDNPKNSRTRQEWLDSHTVDDMREIVQEQRKTASLNTPVGEDADVDLIDFITSDTPLVSIEKNAYLSELREAIGASMYENLNDNQRAVIALRYFNRDEKLVNPITGLVDQETVAQLLARINGQAQPVSSARIGSIEKRALEIMRSSKELKDFKSYINNDAKFSDKPVDSRIERLYDAVFSDKKETGFVSSMRNMFSQQTNDEILKDMTDPEGKGLYKPGTLEEWKKFANNTIEGGLDQAVRKFREGDLESGQRTALGLYLSMALDQRAMELHKAGKFSSSVRSSVLAKDIAIETSMGLTQAAQELNGAKLLSQYSTTTVLSKMQRDIKKQYNAQSVKLKEEIEGQAKQIHDGLVDINSEVAEELVGSIKEEVQKVARKKVAPISKGSIVDNTIAKLENHIVDSGEKDTIVKRVVRQMNEMFKNWFSDKNHHEPSGEYTMAIVRKFLKEDPEVMNKWESIRDNLTYEYGEYFETPQDFFDYYLTLPESEVALNARIHKSLKLLQEVGRIPDLNNITTEKDIYMVVNELMKTNQPRFKPAIIARVKKLIKQNKEDHVAQLAKRVVNMAKTEPTTPKENKIRDMMNMIVKIAREELPKKTIIPRDPMDLIVKAFENREDYQKIWTDTKDLILEKYPEMTEEIQALQQFFDRPIDDFIAKTVLGKAISRGFKTEDTTIEDLVKKHYTEQTLALESLSEKLVNQAGLVEEDAENLARMIENKFADMTRNKKEKLLNKIFGKKDIKPKAKQTLIDRIIAYSNIGAFSEEQYKDAICEKLGMTVITPEISRIISELCDKIQTAEYRSELSKDSKHEVQWSTTYKYVLYSDGEEVGRYNTLEEAHDHTPKGTEWTDNPRLIGSELKDEYIMHLRYILASTNNVGLGRKVSTAQTVAMLLNGQTIDRNVVGNELVYWTKGRTTKILAVPLDMARSKFTGADRTIAFKRNNSLASYVRGLKFGVDAAMRGWTPMGLQGQYELGFNPSFDKSGWFVKNTLGFLEKMMRVTLLGLDQAAITRAYEDKLSELAVLQCLNSNQKVNKENIERNISKMEENLWGQAVEYAKIMTFQNDNNVTKVASSIKRGLNFGQDFGAGDVIMKFTKVPANLTLLALEFSPFGFIRGAYIATQHMRHGKLGGKEKDIGKTIEAFSEALIGSIGFTGFGIWMGMMGIMTGKEDDDPRKKLYDRSLGKGLYKFNISAFNRYILSGLDGKACDWRPGDNVIGYSWAEPLSTSVAMGVSVANDAKKNKINGKKWTLNDMALAGVTAFRTGAGVVFDRSIFEGINSIFEVPPGETLTGERIIQNIFTETAVNLPASFIPAVVRQARVITDPYSRVTWEGDNILETSMNKLKDKLPIASKTLTAQEDYFGAPMEKNKGMQDHKVLNIGMNLVLPMYVNKFEIPTESSRRLIYDIYKQSGQDVLPGEVESEDPNALPGTLGTTLMIGKTKVKLTNDEYRELKEIRGARIDELVQKSNILNSNKPIGKKVERLHEIYSEAGAYARNRMRRDVKVSRGL